MNPAGDNTGVSAMAAGSVSCVALDHAVPAADFATEKTPRPWWKAFLQWALRAFRSFLTRARSSRTQKTLHLRETLPLGEKRFVAVVEVDQERFLIGASANSVSMLARLQAPESFARTLERTKDRSIS